MESNFETCTNLNQYWIQQDCLRSLDFDLYFSVASRYYCDAGCKVCYIEKNLKQTKDLNLYNGVVFRPELWDDIFSYFSSIRTNDDYAYLNKNFPEIYQWYKEHPMELCVTDNSLVRTLALKDLTIKKFADISISSEFVNSVGSEKVIEYLKRAKEFGLDKVKIIDCGHSNLKEIIDWVLENVYNNCVHDDFRVERKILDAPWAEYQNTWVEHVDNRLLKINKEAIHLYNNTFYFSSDDASDITINPFHSILVNFHPEEFLCDMIEGKQEQYKEWAKLSSIQKFKEYFTTTENYKVNRDFNFIPGIMFNSHSPFFNKMRNRGWVDTKLGLFDPQYTDEVTSIIGKK